VSISQLYCLSFKYSSTCFWHPHAHHQELINCSSRLWFMHVLLTLILLTWRIWWAPNNASKQQMGFNSAFKGLNQIAAIVLCSFCLMFLYTYVSPACLTFIYLGSVSPCIITHSDKSINLMRQSLRFIACCLTFWHRSFTFKF